jgi:hypothetical protein
MDMTDKIKLAAVALLLVGGALVLHLDPKLHSSWNCAGGKYSLFCIQKGR